MTLLTCSFVDGSCILIHLKWPLKLFTVCVCNYRSVFMKVFCVLAVII